MIRHVSAVVIVLCLNTASLSAQTTGAQSTELTVKTASANVHKFASIGSPVIAKVQRGTVLEITRNLGSMVEVPWPAGEGGVAFLHVNAGSIGHRSAPDSNRFATKSAPPVPASAAIASSAAGGEQQIAAAVQPGSRRPVYISLPSHIIGLGGRMSASTPGFGATARTWWGNRLGFQFEASRYPLDSVAAPGHLTSFQFAPSVLYSLPDGVSNSLWVRPYLGGGGSVYRATLSGGTSGLADSADKGLGLQAFGGAEATFSGVPRFALSADVGYRWSQTTFAGFEPRKIGFSLSAHWYVK